MRNEISIGGFKRLGSIPGNPEDSMNGYRYVYIYSWVHAHTETGKSLISG